MAMPMAYCVPGAEVEKVLEVASKVEHDDGSGPKWTEHKFKAANPKRRGFITRTQYPGDETYSSDAVLWVEVKFEKGKPAEKCLPSQLNLVKVANEAALMALKNETAIQKANDGLLDDMRKPIAIDQTGVGKTKPGKGLSRDEAKELE
jgi:hypothetical protein